MDRMLQLNLDAVRAWNRAHDAKKAFWRAHIGEPVSAQSFRGFTATGKVLSVCDGVWGSGDESVALELDVKDDYGLKHWPASRCEPAAHLKSEPNPITG